MLNTRTTTPLTTFAKSLALQPRFNAIIPGGCHTYAKGDDQYPEGLAPYITHGRGSHVWDVDGNEYIEYGPGLRSVTLGHAFAPVLDAVRRQIELGTNFLRPSPIELECAEQLAGILPNAEMVKFAKDGSDVTSAAVKLARAHTGRDLVAICGDHPFFSVDDWFIGTTAVNAGIPEAIRQLTLKFKYNDIGSLQALFAEHPGRIAAVILEPERTTPPQHGFLRAVQDECRAQGAVFILDEMITGFRWHLRGAQHVHQVQPDLSTFGKALANGFSLAALTGRREIMELGGLNHSRERVFLISTTHGAETHALAAAMATMDYFSTNPVIETLYARGERLRLGLRRAIDDLDLGDYVSIAGRDCCLMYGTKDPEGKPSQPFRTLFLQETIRRGLLAPQFIVCYSHSEADIDQTIERVHEALVVYRKALNEGVAGYLRGRPVQPVYRRYN